MVLYDRSDSTAAAVTAEWERGFSWIAQPHERAQRASHAIETEEGVWILDPIDAPNVRERIESMGDVAGIGVLSSYHARDAGTFARRHDVSVHIPTWMDRVTTRVTAPVESYTFSPSSSFRVLPCRPFPGWQETFWYHGPTATLVTPDSLGTTDVFCVGDERLGLELLRRLQPPTALAGLEPERVLVGHGEPVTVEPVSALREAIDSARWTFPKALLENGPESMRSIMGALRG